MHPTRPFLVLLAGLGLQIISGSPAGFGPIDFEKDQPGKPAEGFAVATGRWEVVQDGKNRVFAQRASNRDDAFNVALYVSNVRNIDISVRLRADAGELDRGGGVVWRAKDAKNYYLARFNPLENNFRVYKVEAGKRTQFASADVPGDTAWHTLRVTMFGDEITCYLDGKKYLAVKDNTFPGHGMYGLWTKSDARSSFDDLSVKAYE
jgi:hypothetical protein